MSFTKNKGSQIKRSVMKYHGGKFQIASWIVSHFSEHQLYVEPYGGAASVLLHKEPSRGEIYNELDGAVVNLFRVLRDPIKAAELERVLRLTPYSRDEYKQSYEDSEDPVELARRTIVRSFMGFGPASASRSDITGFRSNLSRERHSSVVDDWQSYPDHMASFCKRMMRVVIENRDSLEVIKQHDKADTLFYLDPPYVHSTRYPRAVWRDCYKFEMTDDQHRKLAQVLRTAKGKVIISGYSSALYDKELYPDWMRVEKSAHANGGKDRTEILWLNEHAAGGVNQKLLF